MERGKESLTAGQNQLCRPCRS